MQASEVGLYSGCWGPGVSLYPASPGAELRRVRVKCRAPALLEVTHSHHTHLYQATPHCLEPVYTLSVYMVTSVHCNWADIKGRQAQPMTILQECKIPLPPSREGCRLPLPPSWPGDTPASCGRQRLRSRGQSCHSPTCHPGRRQTPGAE